MEPFTDQLNFATQSITIGMTIRTVPIEINILYECVHRMIGSSFTITETGTKRAPGQTVGKTRQGGTLHEVPKVPLTPHWTAKNVSSGLLLPAIVHQFLPIVVVAPNGHWGRLGLSTGM